MSRCISLKSLLFPVDAYHLCNVDANNYRIIMWACHCKERYIGPIACARAGASTSMSVRVHSCAFVCIRVRPYASVCVRVRPCASVCVRVRPCASVCVRVRPCASVCVRVRPCASVCVRVRPCASVCVRMQSSELVCIITMCMCGMCFANVLVYYCGLYGFVCMFQRLSWKCRIVKQD